MINLLKHIWLIIEFKKFNNAREIFSRKFHKIIFFNVVFFK